MKKVLIVDDSKKWVLYHETAVREVFNNEVEIDTASSAKDGVEKLTLSVDKPYDFILTDRKKKRHYFIGYKYNFYVMQKCAIV